MSRFGKVEVSGDPEAKALWESIRAGFGTVPNVLDAMSPRPDLASTMWSATQKILLDGRLPVAVKQMIMVAVSVQRGCRYCTAAHRAQARALGVPDEFLEGFVMRKTITSVTPAQRTILEFALKASSSPQSITETDFERVRNQGMGDAEIVEIVMTVGVTQWVNMIADISDVDVDPQWR